MSYATFVKEDLITADAYRLQNIYPGRCLITLILILIFQKKKKDKTLFSRKETGNNKPVLLGIL